MSWVKRLLNVLRPTRLDRELDEELDFHLQARCRDNLARGMSEREAFMDALRRFGKPTLLREEAREADSLHWLQVIGHDVRYALRGFCRNPGFTFTALVSLALGIGANSAIFSALDAAFWKALPVADPQTLVNFSIMRTQGDDETDLPAAFAHQLRDSGVFQNVITSSADGLSFSYNDGAAERIIGQVVSPDYFRALGVPPMIGRDFAEQQNGQWAAEVVLAYDFWMRRFGGDPAVIGRTIRLNTYPFTIVGVQPRSFFGVARGSDYELRLPFLPDNQELKEVGQVSGKPDRWLGTVARLRPGQSAAQAEAAADAQLQAFLKTTPINEFRQAGLRHLRLLPGSRGDLERTLQFEKPLYALLTLVGIVLLIACANVAGMLLARATARARELSVRVSIGASRSRLVQQLLTESLLLSIIGGALGVVVAYWATELIVGFIPDGHVSVVLNLRPDTRTLLFTLALALATGVFSGLAPALQASKRNLTAVLRSETTSSGGERRDSRLQRFLIVSEVAFSLLLVTASETFLHTLHDLRPSDYHAEPSRVLLFTLKPQQEVYSEQQKLDITADLVQHVGEIPGVRSVALAEFGPLGTRTSRGIATTPGHDPVRLDMDQVSPDFFVTVGLPLVAGRDFESSDRVGSPLVAIVDQAFALALFPDENPLGHTFYVGPSQRRRGPFQIIGVTADVHYYDLHKAPQPTAWFAIQQQPPYMPTLHVRADVKDAASVTAAVRRMMEQLAPGVPVFNIRTMDSRVQDSLMQERMIGNLSGGFGALAVAMTGIGLYGILAYSVVRRTKEIGIRRALGSRTGSVIWMVAGEALLLAGAGSIVGALLVAELSRLWSHYLIGVRPVTPTNLAFGGLVMLLLSLVAVVIPSIRACRIDPLAALRQ